MSRKEKRAAALELLRSSPHLSYQQIADAVGLHMISVCRISVENGLARGRKRVAVAPEPVEQLLRNPKLTYQQIADKRKISVASVVRISKKAGLTRKRGSSKKADSALVLEYCHNHPTEKQADIAARFHLTQSTLSKYMRDGNIHRGRKVVGFRYPDEVRNCVMQFMRDNPLVVTKYVAQKFGIHHYTLRVWVKKYNVPRMTGWPKGSLEINAALGHEPAIHVLEVRRRLHLNGM